MTAVESLRSCHYALVFHLNDAICLHHFKDCHVFFYSSQNQVHEDDSLEDQEVKRIFQVYDLVNDEKESNHHVPEEEADHQSKEVEEDTDTILCNSVKMIREKLTISNGKLLLLLQYSLTLL